MQPTITIFSWLLLYVYSAEIGDKCDLGFNRTGKCLVIDDCHVAINDLRNNIRPITCGFLKNKPLVCCRSPSKRFQKVRTHCYPEVTYGLQEDGTYIAAGIGGFDSLAKEFPHMSALGYRDGDEIVWGCGGTLISPDFVLTAAHCLVSRSLGSLKHVRLGDLNLKRTDDDAKPQDFTVKRTYKHPDYRPPSQYNDIALVQLDREVDVDEFVRPACLNGDQKKNASDLIATGWGQLGVGADLAEHLQKMFIHLVPETSCQNSYSKHKGSRRLPNGIIATQICAGAPKIDTCAGDSGGPLQLVNSNTVYGVTSFGIACGISTAPGVYTRVSSYIDWIDSIVWPKRDNYYEAI